METSSHLIWTNADLVWTSSHLISTEREVGQIKREVVPRESDIAFRKASFAHFFPFVKIFYNFEGGNFGACGYWDGVGFAILKLAS